MVVNRWSRITMFALLPVAAAVAVYVGRFQVLPLLSAYGLLSVGRFSVQTWMALTVQRRRPKVKSRPWVTIVLTAYNEDPHYLGLAMASLEAQRWPNFEVIVVDDGSENSAEVKHLANKYGFTYMYQVNQGKRFALRRGFDYADPRSAYILTADSDTFWDEHAIEDMVATFQANRKVGAVTGHIDTWNGDESFLVRMVTLRYWLAFQIERAAQSWHGVVTCVSGPLGGYRRVALEEVKQDFVTQRFLGKLCTYGDDRHLTNLILGAGYEVHYSQAKAWTVSPSRLRPYLRQQARWGRSYWREQLWTLKALPLHSLMLAVDWGVSMVLPFLLLASLGWYGWLTVTEGSIGLVHFVGMLVATSLFRAVPAIAVTRNWSFLLLPVFSVFHLFVLLPLKFYSLATVTARAWGSRTAVTQ